jgi:hypothetical protein
MRVQVLPSTCNITATSCCFVPKAGAVCVAVCEVAGGEGNMSCAIMLRTRVGQVAGVDPECPSDSFSPVLRQKPQRGFLLLCFLWPVVGTATLPP